MSTALVAVLMTAFFFAGYAVARLIDRPNPTTLWSRVLREDGSVIDEFVVKHGDLAIHAEQMSDTHYWLAVYAGHGFDDPYLHLNLQWLGAKKGGLVASLDDSDWEWDEDKTHPAPALGASS